MSMAGTAESGEGAEVADGEEVVGAPAVVLHPDKKFRPDEELPPVLLRLLRLRLLPLLRSSDHRHRLLLLPCGRGSV